jgi:hypothetical protein
MGFLVLNKRWAGAQEMIRDVRNEPLNPGSSSTHRRIPSDSRTPGRGLGKVSSKLNDRNSILLRTKSILFPNDSFKITRELDPKFRIVPQPSVVMLSTSR